MAVSAWPVAHALATYLAHNLMKIFPAASLTAEDIAGMFTDPPNPEMGDYAFPCFPLAKTLHQAPPAIAQKIASSLPADELIAAVQNAGPYVNFTISPASLGKLVVQPILHGDFLQGKFVTPQRIMVEYSQPNTHKVLHVGHMRNLCLGNALVRILRYAGHEVIAATYPGDVGAHVAKCLWYLKNYNQEPIPATERGAWLGKIYTSATRLLDAHKEAGTDGEDKKIITQILNELSSGKGAYYDLWQETRAWSLELFQEAYQWAEIEFDHWYFESQFDASSLALAKKYYAEGKYILSENAIGMDLSEEKLGFCMMIKSDGTGMYATKDIDLGQKKFADFALDRSIYVVDKRQAFHFKQIFATLKKLGFKHADDCYHLEYEFVELPSGPMSSREGNIFPLMDLVATLEKTIKENYL
ncbi:MAG: arginine--tRNA ligase [Bacteriovoracaceae bacterium]|nr:arginine--tRNA ligase [Bacteriovoracaceae bacterium]